LALVRTTLLVLFLTLGVSGALPETVSAETPAQFAAPGVRAPNDPHVNGIRVSFLHGKNERMEGLDIGLLSLSETKDMSGVAFVFGIGKVDGDMESGAHFSLMNLHQGRDSGLNAAFINKTNNPDNALDFGFVNIADGTSLIDIGGLNMSKRSTVQLGFINFTDHIDGFQLGFINVAKNGFLPIFPFFNFAATESE
jgi:hypothetical protein